MILLILISFLAGLATILAPCILPILPVVLSAGVTGGKRRPLGVVVGLVASFTFFTLAISFLIKHFGLNPNVLRTIAILALLIFGLILVIPKLSSFFEAWTSKYLSHNQKTNEHTDFWGGVVIGISLGIVWTPCVGPIMASIITLAATSAVTTGSVLITFAYAIGTSIPLLFLMYGGKSLLARARKLTKYTAKIQQVFGLIMVLTALAMLAGFDQTLEASLLAKLPSSINSGITQALENSSSVQDQLSTLKGKTSTPTPTQTTTSSGLPNLGKAPNFTGISHWLNSDPLSIADLKGKVVLIDFWTYSCINCLRTLPHVTSWYDTYKDQGFVVVGVHAPEFAFEKDTNNVAAAIASQGIHYPVAQDNDLATWSAYNNQYWPAEYLIDAQGNVRATDFGEGNYDQTEANIRALLKEAKLTADLSTSAPSVPDLTPTEDQSPETYLGTERQINYKPSADPNSLAGNQWTLKGGWQISSQYITTGQPGDSLSYKFIGKDVYLVLNPPVEGSATVQVLLDGKPVGTQGGADVQNGVVTIDADRLYHLIHLSDSSVAHLLTLTFQQVGVKAFSFTFG